MAIPIRFREVDVEAIWTWEAIVAFGRAANATGVGGICVAHRDHIKGIKALFAVDLLLRRINIRPLTDICFIFKPGLLTQPPSTP